jgi:hypothetical protein
LHSPLLVPSSKVPTTPFCTPVIPFVLKV